MGSPTTVEQRVQELHDKAVKHLVEAHQQLEDPLLLAVRYEAEDPFDIHIFEVLETFPGDDEDELFSTVYEPSASLRILGKLHLTLASPAQLRAAIRRSDPLLKKLRAGQMVFVDQSKTEGRNLARELGFNP